MPNTNLVIRYSYIFSRSGPVASFHLGGGFRPPSRPQNGTATGWSETQAPVPQPATARGGSNWTDPRRPRVQRPHG